MRAQKICQPPYHRRDCTGGPECDAYEPEDEDEDEEPAPRKPRGKPRDRQERGMDPGLFC